MCNGSVPGVKRMCNGCATSETCCSIPRLGHLSLHSKFKNTNLRPGGAADTLAHLYVDFAGDGPDAGPEVVETGVLDAEPVGQVAGVGKSRAQPYKPYLNMPKSTQTCGQQREANVLFYLSW